jgi:outer membrane murein-binding lipoprotein Lpp
MGFLWDLMQQSQIKEQSERAGTIEARVAQLESEINQMRQTLHEALRRMEQRFGEDLDGDKRIG